METALTTTVSRAAYERLVELLRGGNITVLSGAGLSTFTNRSSHPKIGGHEDWSGQHDQGRRVSADLEGLRR